MRLLSLRLYNFRQFYGPSPEIRFGVGEKNVTVIHGSNGAGKTALLNAFTWVLFGQFSKGFQFPEQLVNKRAIREAAPGSTVEAWVELLFEDDGRKYLVKRSTEVVKTSNDSDWATRNNRPPTLQWAAQDGSWKNEDKVSDIIGRILPPDLHTYFFFDGERIERIVQPTREEQTEIAKATKKLHGIEILERAENHLNAVRKDLEKELQQIGDPETVRLIERKSEVEENINNLKKKQEELHREVDNHTNIKHELENKLRELEEVRADQLRRDQLNQEKEARQESMKQNRESMASIISSHGYAFFLSKSTNEFRTLIDQLRNRGELPAGIKRQFVADLLNKGTCICDRTLDGNQDAKARAAVEDWMRRGGLAEVEEKAIRMGGEVTKIEQMLPETWDRIKHIQDKDLLDRKELSRVENELDEIKQRLEGSPREEISGLQRRLAESERVIAETSHELVRIDVEIKHLNDDVNELENAILKHQAYEERQRIAQRRVDAALDAKKRVARIRELFEAEFRRELLKKIRTLFHSISYTPYIPDMTEAYSLRLLESAGGTPMPVAASQGESQILSLAFIGSVIEQAREYRRKKDRLPGPDSSNFPLVMDSPFGSLDPIYRHQIAEHLPRLADQIIVLVTRTQWRGEVEQSFASRMGHSYVLTYYSPRDDIQVDSIELNGSTYDLIKRSPNEFEYTEIAEVTNA
jgi:DNA sulfur modification protein DndD